MNKEFCTTKEIAEYLGISQKRVWSLLNKQGFIGLGGKVNNEMQFSKAIIGMLKDILKSEEK